MQLLTVREAMQPLPASVPAEASLNEVIAQLSETSAAGLPVVDSTGRYRGTITAQQVEEAMRENALDATAGEMAQDLPALGRGQTLEQALGALLRAGSGLPVIDSESGKILGWLTNLDVLRAYNARLQERLVDGVSRGRAPDVRNVQRALARLRGYRVVELELSGGQRPVGRQLGDVAWPNGATVLALRRGERTIDPRSSERLERGDRLSLLVPAGAADALVETISEGGEAEEEEAPRA